jgi:hypothetical protein
VEEEVLQRWRRMTAINSRAPAHFQSLSGILTSVFDIAVVE